MKPRDPQKIERIYQATLDLVSEIGLAGLTMSKIGKKANLGMGTIYTYFESKEEIINSLYQALKRKHVNAAYAKIEDNQPFTVNFRYIFETLIHNCYYLEKEYFFFEQCKASVFLNQDSIVLEEQLYAKTNYLLETGKADGIIKDMDNYLLIGFIMGGVHGFINQLKRSNTVLTPKLIDWAFDLCCSSIRP